MIHLCSCMNATENVRGINFRLTYLTPEQQVSAEPSSTYAITIEFDDRYNLLHHFSNTRRQPLLPPPPLYTSPPSYQLNDLQKPSHYYNPTEKCIV
ncbi:hypothetical protein BDB01DRAFT_714892 [Pilobolus umbonatus]|nr:hypothetical protein BDB01DRAFT_714892 [Pilobolus umbonatus]